MMHFCYELSDTGVWEAVVYRGTPPMDGRTRTQLVPVPEDCVGPDGDDGFPNPYFGKLRERFPLEVVEG